MIALVCDGDPFVPSPSEHAVAPLDLARAERTWLAVGCVARAVLCALAALAAACTSSTPPDDPRFASEVVGVTYGRNASYGQDQMPEVVLGPPRGAGDRQGSLDVVSLGVGGEIVLRLGLDAIDLDGPDLAVFENAFWVNGDMRQPFAEPGIVGVSADGTTFVDFPCDTTAAPFAGCAGVAPVFASDHDGAPSPFDPAHSGGDLFDLAVLGVARARFVRIRDAERGAPGPPNAGFDLDAVAVLHADAGETPDRHD